MKTLLEGKYFEPISYEWALMIFRDKYRGQGGAPIVRIMGGLGPIVKVIYRELE